MSSTVSDYLNWSIFQSDLLAEEVNYGLFSNSQPLVFIRLVWDASLKCKYGFPLRPLKSESQGQWEGRYLYFNSFPLILKVTNVWELVKPLTDYLPSDEHTWWSVAKFRKVMYSHQLQIILNILSLCLWKHSDPKDQKICITELLATKKTWNSFSLWPLINVKGKKTQSLWVVLKTFR